MRDPLTSFVTKKSCDKFSMPYVDFSSSEKMHQQLRPSISVLPITIRVSLFFFQNECSSPTHVLNDVLYPVEELAQKQDRKDRLSEVPCEFNEE